MLTHAIGLGFAHHAHGVVFLSYVSYFCPRVPTRRPCYVYQLAKIAIALGMTVVISNPNRPPTQDFQDGNDHAVAKRVAIATAIGVRGPALPLDELLCMSDFVSVHLPLTVNTRCMIAARELALMKPSAVIINAARGGIVDEQGA